MVRTRREELRPSPGCRQSIAVIGLGMAGCTAAHYLKRSHNVVAFEALPVPGLHAFGVDDGKFDVDMPLRAVSPHYYPNLYQFYREIGVEMQKVNYQSTGSDVEGNQYFSYRNFMLLGSTIPCPSLRRGTIRETLVIVLSYLWLVLATPILLVTGSHLAGESTAEHFTRHGYHPLFVFRFFLPVMSCLLSCSYQQVLDYPFDLLAEFFCTRQSTLTTSWYRVKTGTKDVARRCLDGVECRYNTRVAFVERVDTGGAIVGFSDGSTKRFDHVVLAVEPNIAIKLLRGQSDDDRRVFESVSYFTARAVAHQDKNLMMAGDPSQWTGLQYFSADAAAETAASPTSAGSVSAHMNQFSPKHRSHCYSDEHFARHYDVSSSSIRVPKGTAPEALYETWNPHVEPDRSKVVKDVEMTRAVWTVRGKHEFEAVAPRNQGAGGLWLAGSYAARGVTLLEQACSSGLHVAADLAGDAVIPFDICSVKHLFWGRLLLSALLQMALILWRIISFLPGLLFTFVVTLHPISRCQRRRRPDYTQLTC